MTHLYNQVGLAEQADGYIGRRLRRREDARLITGRGAYAGDLDLPGLLHMAVLRSPVAHARITSLDVARARALPGVVAVWSAADLSDVAAAMPDVVPAVTKRPRQVLAAEEVRYAGEPIAAVLAESAYLAADAVAAIEVELETLPAVANVLDAIADPDRQGGSIVRTKGDVEAAFAGAAVVERGRFSMGRIAGAAIEPRTGTAVWEAGVLKIWTSTSGHFRVRDAVASVLGLDASRVRVFAPDVGGSFGAKGAAYPEDVLAGLAARRLEKPVRYVLTRTEDLASTNQAHGVVLDLELAAENDGRLRGLRAILHYPLGAYAAGGVPERPLGHLLSAYRVPAAHLELRACFTNTAPTAAVRGGGRPVGNYGIERMMDRLARRLGMDPLELRRRNVVEPDEMPYDTGVDFASTRIVYDSGDFPRLLETAAGAVAYEEARQAQKAGAPVGVALTVFTESTGLGNPEPARARIEPSGKAVFYAGSAPGGQGHLTTLAQVGAERLGWPLERVEAVAGDSFAVPGRFPTGGSRTAVEAGNAVALAATSARRLLRERAGERLEADAADIEVSPAGAHVRGAPTRRLPLAEVVGEHGLEVSEVFEAGSSTFATGALGVVVELDPETLAVRLLRCAFAHDSGREINPMVVEGQVHGGFAHGLGYALFEESVYDRDATLLASTFLDYTLVSAPEIPLEPDILTLPTRTSHNPEGFKGAGESGAVPTPAAVANAIEDALHSLGHRVAVDHVPATPRRLFELTHRA